MRGAGQCVLTPEVDKCLDSPSQIARRERSEGFCCDHGVGHIGRARAECWTREALYCALHVRAHRRLRPRCIAEQYRKCEENFRSGHVKDSASTIDLESLADLADALPLQILPSNLSVDHNLLVLEQHHDVRAAEG